MDLADLLASGSKGSTAYEDAWLYGFRASAGVDPGVPLTVLASPDKVGEVESRVERLERAVAPVRAPVTTLAPAPYSLSKPFEVVLEQVGSGFVASFYDAGIVASGDDRVEAFTNLKDMVVGVWELLSERDPGTLGPGPARQLAVLREFITT